MNKLFTCSDAWTGGNVDALMFFGPATLNEAIAVSKALWSFPRLTGPYSNRHLEPDEQPLIEHPTFTLDGWGQLIGVYAHHDGAKSAFVHTTILGEDGLWVYAGPTVGGLPAEWGVGAYPFADGRPTNWLVPLYDDLRLVVQHVARCVPLLAATYGWLTTIDCDILLEAIAGTVPVDRWGPIDVWRDGERHFYPATHLEAPMRTDA